jgi:dihydropteroate synthase
MKTLSWGKRTFIMGILNLTPDSFSGDGLLRSGDPLQAAVEQARQFSREGADILDLGAESSRPGSETIGAAQEIERLLPALQAIRAALPEALISIDTFKAATAKICLENGADWINDIWGLRADKDLAGVIAAYNAGAILMHNRSHTQNVDNLGNLGRSYSGAQYGDVIEDIKADLTESIRIAKKAGIADGNIILDPGIGFGKSIAQNLAIINRLDEFKILGYPLLIGPSRKSFIGQVLGMPVDEREEGTAAVSAIGIARGADIVRVHNVQVMARVIRMSDAIIRGLPKEDPR